MWRCVHLHITKTMANKTRRQNGWTVGRIRKERHAWHEMRRPFHSEAHEQEKKCDKVIFYYIASEKVSNIYYWVMEWHSVSIINFIWYLLACVACVFVCVIYCIRIILMLCGNRHKHSRVCAKNKTHDIPVQMDHKCRQLMLKHIKMISFWDLCE